MDELPNDGFYFQPQEPQAQTDAKSVEKAEAVQLLPVVDDLLAWFDGCIEATDSIATAKSEAIRRELPVETVVVAYDIVRELLEQKKNELRSKKLTFKQD